MKQFLVNRTKLKASMVEHSIDRKTLCEYLDITYQSLNMKLKGQCGFTENEISILFSLFGANIFLFNLATKNGVERRRK